MAKKQWTLLAMSREGRVGVGLAIVGLAAVSLVPAGASLGWFQFSYTSLVVIFVGSVLVVAVGFGLVIHAYVRPDAGDNSSVWATFYRPHGGPQEVRTPSYTPLDYAEANNFVAQRNAHHAQLRNGLRLIPSGKPDFASSWGDLQDHLSGEEFADVWQMERRFRELVPFVRGETDKALEHLYDERRKVGHEFHILSGSQAVLTPRVYASIEGTETDYPSNPWLIEPSVGKTLLKFGREYGTAYVESTTDEEAVKAAQREIWDAIPTWPEVEAARQAQLELTRLRPQLQARLAEISALPGFPGHCKHCPAPPGQPQRAEERTG